MTIVFYVAAAVALIATLKAITQLNGVRALLYLMVSLLAVAVIDFLLGAPFAAALEVITYAGAIMVLFIFVVMMLNLGPATVKQERSWMSPGIWAGPSVLALVLLGALGYAASSVVKSGISVISPQRVGLALFGPYAPGVELASLLLLAGLVGAYHLGFRGTR